MCGNNTNLIEINFPPCVEKLSNEELCRGTTRIVQPLNYNEFFERFLLANRPCVISDFVTKEWPCLQTWVSCGEPHYNYLANKYGKFLFNE